ncbi:unnamed protein product [Auanema sp. JU1783]|nr:unnamed protein product [Auanema sp. JU1783]
MADAGGDEVQVSAAATDAPAQMDVQQSLKAVLRSAHFADGLAKGLHEAAKALDKREAHFCVLAENCDEPQYVKLPIRRSSENGADFASTIRREKPERSSDAPALSLRITETKSKEEPSSRLILILRRFQSAKEKMTNEIHLLGWNLTHKPKYVQFLALASAIFVLYIGYGYMQELIFKLPGMKPFGWYLTLIQFFVYSGLGYCECLLWHDTSRRIPLKVYVLIAFFTVATMGLSNASVGYLNYPTQVIFKCCKLIPVLIGGIIIQGKRYGCLDIFAAILMSLGLIMFTLADSQVSPNFEPRGYVMISGALLADAVIGNIQEKNMKKFGGSSNEVVLYSYSIGSMYILGYVVVTGEIFDAFIFFWQNPWKTYGYALLFGLLGYLGVNVVLTLIKVSGALVAVTVTTLRKAVTIILSFVLFSKPFSVDYIWAGLVILLAIYLNLYSKNKESWNTKIRHFVGRFFYGRTPIIAKRDFEMV